MSVTIKTKKKETVFISRYYFTKKFQGLGVLFDTDVPQGFLYCTVLLIKINLFFFSFWLSVDYRNRGQKIVVQDHRASEITFNREHWNKILTNKNQNL